MSSQMLKFMQRDVVPANFSLWSDLHFLASKDQEKVGSSLEMSAVANPEHYLKRLLREIVSHSFH